MNTINSVQSYRPIKSTQKLISLHGVEIETQKIQSPQFFVSQFQEVKEILFIDSRINNYEQLKQGVTSSISQVVLLEANQDGILQISQFLKQYTGITAIHIISHAGPGSLQLGSTELNLQTFHSYVTEIQQWSEALALGADILIYGCNLAAERSGVLLLEELRRLTGANIAASKHPVGCKVLGGQWQLDVELGIVTTPLAFCAELLETYRDIFAVRINAGGGQYTDSSGKVWLADTYFTGGNTYVVTSAIGNTTLDPLYQNERSGKSVAYAIPVTNGTYDVGLALAELYWSASGKRIFDISIEGQLFSDNLDLFAQAGKFNAYNLIKNNVTVSDGVLNISLVSSVDNASITAIEVVPDGTPLSLSPSTPLTNLRINAGGGQYTDSSGKVWLADTYFTGGSTYSVTSAIGNTTLDPLYQNERSGKSISYAIPVTNGTYDVGLALAELYWSTSGKRIFDISIEGQLFSDNLDLFAQAGKFNAYNLIKNNVTVSDGVLNISLVSSVDNASITAIEVVPDGIPLSLSPSPSPSPTPTPTPTPGAIRINTGGTQYTDKLGQTWQADTYFSGGGTYSVASTTEIYKTEDDPIYRNERSGKTLSYAIPVSEGTYTVNLHFAELYWNDYGKRVFDVNVEGDLVLDDLDIFASSKNAFFPGKFSALVQSIPQVFVNDGTLNIDMSASVNNASITGIEIIPLQGAAVIIKQTNGKTEVSEAGGNDSYSIVLNTKPSADVTINLQKDSQINTNKTSVIFTPTNWDIPQTITVSAVNDTAKEGTHSSTITHTVSSNDTSYKNLTLASVPVTIQDNDTVSVSFTKKTVATLSDPTVATWGPDGRLYVGSYDGTITAFTFDNNYNVTATQTINTIKNQYNAQILGIAFNPFDTQPKIYVSHSKLYANGGGTFPITELSPYSGQVSVLSGSTFSTLTPLITSIGLSNHDHGVNGLEFDNQGNLYIAVGSTTNAGITASELGGVPESPFTAAILKAEITKSGFNGKIEYTVPSGSIVPTSYPSGYTPPPGVTIGADDHQVNGGVANVVPGVNVSVYASGLRNSFDLTYTTKGKLYATDNGANAGFGDYSTSATTQAPMINGAPDELNLIVPGAYYGHPNRNRGRTDSRQNVYYSANTPSGNGYTAPLTTFSSSTNGITEYRANTFNGQLRGNLITQDWNGPLYNVKLSSDGSQVVQKETWTGVLDGLDLLTGPGGVLISPDLSQDSLTVATPNDAGAVGLTVYDIFPWRAPATSGKSFVLGGANFGTLTNTTVKIGGVQAQLSSVSSNRIKGTLPSLTGFSGLQDIVVSSAGQTYTLLDAFLPLA